MGLRLFPLYKLIRSIDNVSEEPESVDANKFVVGLVNMKTEIELLKGDVQKGLQEVKNDLSENKVNRTIIEEILEKVMSSITEISESTTKTLNGDLPIPEVELSNTNQVDRVIDTRVWQTLQITQTKIFELLGNIMGKLESQDIQNREIKEMVRLWNEKFATLTGQYEGLTRVFNTINTESQINSKRWFELSKFQAKIVLVALAISGAAFGFSEFLKFIF